MAKNDKRNQNDTTELNNEAAATAQAPEPVAEPVETPAAEPVADTRKAFEVLSGPLPTPSATAKQTRGMTAIVTNLQPGQYFRVARKDGKRDTSKAANIVQICKKYGVKDLKRMQEDANWDIYYREAVEPKAE